MNRPAARLALALTLSPGAGPTLLKRGVAQFGSFEALFEVPRQALTEVEGMDKPFVEAWARRRDFLDAADQMLDEAQANGVDVVTLEDEAYPALLREITDPPAALFVRGALRASMTGVAIVGSRETTAYGEKTAFAFGRDLAQAGVTVVSGMARGIDSFAHRGALEVGGTTWAVLGGGLLNPRSYTSRELADAIVRDGAVVSEYPLHEEPRPGYYPRRNRIVSGLCGTLIVIEAGRQSGALITAGLALEQGRDVYAVPANIDSHFSAGSNWLLSQGARPACSTQDILDALGVGEPATAARAAAATLTEDERRMIGALSARRLLHLDDWIEQSGRSSSEALALIGSLVLKGAVAERPGKFYAPEGVR